MPTFLVCADEAHAGKAPVLKYVLVLVLVLGMVRVLVLVCDVGFAC